MNIGEAVELIKEHKLVRRAGWNGKGMHIYLEDMYRYNIKGGVYAGIERKHDAVVCLFTAQGTHQAGWVCSQQDLLATDWEEVKGA